MTSEFYAGLFLGYAIGCISTACIISYKMAMDKNINKGIFCFLGLHYEIMERNMTIENGVRIEEVSSRCCRCNKILAPLKKLVRNNNPDNMFTL